ncbi:MAG: hypothetical protein WCB67_15650 [Solirubrobacteraceae bacterium]
MSGYGKTAFAIALAALAAAGILLVSFVLARAVQEKAPLPPLLGRAAPMAPAAWPRLAVGGGQASGHTRASIRATGMILIDRHRLQAHRCLFSSQPGFVALARRAPVWGRS